MGGGGSACTVLLRTAWHCSPTITVVSVAVESEVGGRAGGHIQSLSSSSSSLSSMPSLSSCSSSSSSVSGMSHWGWLSSMALASWTSSWGQRVDGVTHTNSVTAKMATSGLSTSTWWTRRLSPLVVWSGPVPGTNQTAGIQNIGSCPFWKVLETSSPPGMKKKALQENVEELFSLLGGGMKRCPDYSIRL